MKHQKIILALFLAVLGAGCGKSSPSNDTSASPSPTTETQASGTETQASATAPSPTASTDTSTSQSSMAATQPATTGDSTVSQQLAQVKQDMNQTAQDMTAYTYAQKDEFVKALQLEMNELNAELIQLSAKIDRASDAVKAAAQPKLDALKTQFAALGLYVEEAKNATAATWDEVKADAKKAYDQAKQDFHDADQWIDQQTTQ